MASGDTTALSQHVILEPSSIYNLYLVINVIY